MARYACPVCKAANHEHMKYCYQCGTWLQSTAFPAKKISSGSRALKTGIIVPIVIVALILIGLYGWNNSTTFDRMELGDQFVISQFTVERPFFRQPAAVADLTAVQAIDYPFEVQAVFYDSGNNRLGTASALITNGMTAGQTSTISFQFDGRPQLSSLSQVRVEIKPLSLLDLLEKAADRLDNIGTP